MAGWLAGHPASVIFWSIWLAYSCWHKGCYICTISADIKAILKKAPFLHRNIVFILSSMRRCFLALLISHCEWMLQQCGCKNGFLWDLPSLLDSIDQMMSSHNNVLTCKWRHYYNYKQATLYFSRVWKMTQALIFCREGCVLFKAYSSRYQTAFSFLFLFWQVLFYLWLSFVYDCLRMGHLFAGSWFSSVLLFGRARNL